MSGLRLFSKIIIALLEVWASYAYVNSKIGNTIMFPLVSPSEENIPYYKLQNSKIVSFNYFCILRTFSFYKRKRENITNTLFLKHTYLL